MKRFGIILIASAFVFSSGFFKKSEDGSYSIDTTSIEKKTTDAIETKATAEAEKMAATSTSEMVAAAKKAVAQYDITDEEILADLAKTKDEIVAKVAAMDKTKLIAYLSKYKEVFAGTEGKMAEYTKQIKNLSITQKYSAKGKELKASMKKYTDQYDSLKTQAAVYVEKLESYGVNLSSYGIDLSKYGL